MPTLYHYYIIGPEDIRSAHPFEIPDDEADPTNHTIIKNIVIQELLNQKPRNKFLIPNELISIRVYDPFYYRIDFTMKITLEKIERINMHDIQFNDPKKMFRNGE